MTMTFRKFLVATFAVLTLATGGALTTEVAQPKPAAAAELVTAKASYHMLNSGCARLVVSATNRTMRKASMMVTTVGRGKRTSNHSVGAFSSRVLVYRVICPPGRHNQRVHFYSRTEVWDLNGPDSVDAEATVDRWVTKRLA